MGASALAQVRFSTQTSTARDGCAEVSVMMLRAWYMKLQSWATVAVSNSYVSRRNTPASIVVLNKLMICRIYRLRSAKRGLMTTRY